MKEELEIWKDIPGYEGLYQVSNLGRVKSLDREVSNGKSTRLIKQRILKLCNDGKGYKVVNLSKCCKVKTFAIHQLVAVAFLNHKPSGYNGYIVDHINNNKNDNRLVNLQLTTARINTSKDKKNKTSKYTGVCRDKKRNKWRSQITINGKVKKLGYYTDELAASHAYQKALKELL